MAGSLIAGDPRAEWRGAALDSRRVEGGELFFALRGEKSDGHLYVGAALAAGAAAAVVERLPAGPLPTGAALIQVRDSYAALHALTRAVRREVPRHLVGITGSVGKTTTKELLAAMLARRYRVSRSPGNLNNLYGFPLALLGIPDDTEWMVAELGMSTPGELARISSLARPDVAMLIAVRPAHLEFFGTLAAIAEAKAEIFAGLPDDGLIVANADDEQVARVVRREQERRAAAGGPVRVVWYGHGDRGGRDRKLNLRVRDVVPEAGGAGSRFILEGDDGAQEIALPLLGTHNVDNCLAAAAGAHALGVSLAEIAAAVATAQPAAGRGVVHRLPIGATLIDDSYNANPDAMQSALEAAARLPGERRWCVLGDMLELGEQAALFHRRVGAAAAVRGFAPIAAVGELAGELAAAAGSAAIRFADAAAAAQWAAHELRPGDVVLVKGSRGIHLEAVVEALRTAGGRAD
ncbi:MAG: UDP-N-acetylmuramoyl-tripeptide--D-alanyl-D-alanine ligase [Acidobacteriota bacterium]